MNLFLLFRYGLVSTFVVLLATFLSVMVSDSVEGHISQLLGLHTKNPILKFLGIGMGGVLLALQALMSYKRAKALEDTANAQAEAAKAQAKATEEQAKANRNTEQGQRQERLKNAIEHLGHNNASVRLGGAYELFHLAEDTKDLRQTVLDILCAHIRRTTGESEYREKYKSKPSEEIQSLLTLLFVQEHEVFEGLHINLQESWLNGAELSCARLREAELNRAQLQGTILGEAQLHSASLFEARMRGAYLVRAQLHGAVVYEAQLQGANLGRALLRGASLFGAELQGANLAMAHLQGAILGGAGLQGAHLFQTQLRGVRCEEDYIPFVQSMVESVGQNSDLSGVVFAGGLSQERVNSFVKDLSNDDAERLQEELEPHMNQPESNELPEDSGAITGTYTKEEAEQWIAEYNEAMSEVPTESDN